MLKKHFNLGSNLSRALQTLTEFFILSQQSYATLKFVYDIGTIGPKLRKNLGKRIDLDHGGGGLVVSLVRRLLRGRKLFARDLAELHHFLFSAKNNF